MKKEKIGYTVKIDSEEEMRQLFLMSGCLEVIQVQDEQDNYDKFADYLSTYNQAQLVVVNIESLGLQLNQLAPLLEIIINEKLDFVFIEKQGMSNYSYLELLYRLAVSEKEIISRRTRKYLRVARSKGVVSGRPAINQDIIDEIKYLYTSNKRTLREISVACSVSLGTVHKYINQLKEDVS